MVSSIWFWSCSRVYIESPCHVIVNVYVKVLAVVATESSPYFLQQQDNFTRLYRLQDSAGRHPQVKVQTILFPCWEQFAPWAWELVIEFCTSRNLQRSASNSNISERSQNKIQIKHVTRYVCMTWWLGWISTAFQHRRHCNDAWHKHSHRHTPYGPMPPGENALPTEFEPSDVLRNILAKTYHWKGILSSCLLNLQWTAAF